MPRRGRREQSFRNTRRKQSFRTPRLKSRNLEPPTLRYGLRRHNIKLPAACKGPCRQHGKGSCAAWRGVGFMRRALEAQPADPLALQELGREVLLQRNWEAAEVLPEAVTNVN